MYTIRFTNNGAEYVGECTNSGLERIRIVRKINSKKSYSINDGWLKNRLVSFDRKQFYLIVALTNMGVRTSTGGFISYENLSKCEISKVGFENIF